MIITRKALSRRTLLRGFGTSIALPFLDGMVPALAAPNRAGAKPAVRMAFLYVPNGIIMKDWTPKTDGKSYELPKTLQPLALHRDRMVVLSGLDQYNGQALGAVYAMLAVGYTMERLPMVPTLVLMVAPCARRPGCWPCRSWDRTS